MITREVLFKLNRYSVCIANNHKDMKAIQKLRFDVFQKYLPLYPSNSEATTDCDEFDPYCRHLIVIENTRNQIVGTYRMLFESKAKEMTGFYCETEFNTQGLYDLEGMVLEVSRSTVHSAHHHKGVINLLWQGIGKTLLEGNFSYLVGLCSVKAEDTQYAANVFDYLTSQAHSEFGSLIEPKEANRVKLPSPNKDIRFNDLPPLLKGYLRLGCKLIGSPSIDPHGIVISFPILVATKAMNPAYKRRFTRYVSNAAIS